MPPDKSYGEMLRTGELSTEYIQAAGLPDVMTVEIRKPGGEQWGVDWVRYTVATRTREPNLSTCPSVWRTG